MKTYRVTVHFEPLAGYQVGTIGYDIQARSISAARLLCMAWNIVTIKRIV